MAGYLNGPVKRISIRRQREALADNVLKAKVTEVALEAFLNLGFWGRMKWLFFGAARVWR